MTTLKKLFIPVCIILIIRVLFQIYFFNSLEHKAQDSLFRIRGVEQVSGDIVIVAIDDNTFQALNRPWPFPRDMHAKLINNLKKAGAKEIIFDIEFTEYSNPYSDAALAVAAANAGNVVFAGKYIVDPENPNHQQVQTPIQPLLDLKMNWGIVNMPTDWDGFIREYTLFEKMDKVNYYSIGVAGLGNYRLYVPDWEKGVTVANKYLNVANYRIPIISGKNALINFYGPAETFTHISYASVIDDSTTDMPGYQGMELNEFYDLKKSDVFKDKIVLVGATIEELHDKFPTAFSSKLTSGVEIHANFMEMVRHNNYLYNINAWLFFLIELFLAMAIFYLLSYMRPQLSVLITLALIVLLLITSFCLFKFMNLLIPIVELALALILIYISALIMHYLKSQKDKKFIKNSFEKYLAPELVSVLLKDPTKLKYGGSLQELTVLFTDIVSFTTFTEKHKPEETVQMLRGYLTAMVKTIIKNGGIIDKFVGDEIMALFGVPVYTEEHAIQACRTALDMRATLMELRAQWEADGVEPFDFGVGINTGQAVVGNLGSEQLFDYTAIGDTINLGARLEAKTRDYDLSQMTIISEFTYEKVKDRVEARYLDDIKVKGKDISVKIYELISVKD